MRIKLVMPPRNFVNEGVGLISIPPLGIAHISSYLNMHGQQSVLDDLEIKFICDKRSYIRLLSLQQSYSQQELEDYLLDRKTSPILDELTGIMLSKLDYEGFDAIGFSIIEGSSKDYALLISKSIKDRDEKTKIIFGGESATSDLKERFDFIDEVIIGQGERQLLRLIKGEDHDDTGCDGGFPKPMPDFTGLPFDCYRNVPEYYYYRNPGRIFIIPYLWSMNCPYRCSFCGASIGDSPPPVIKSVDNTVKEMKALSEKFDSRYFFVLNSYIEIDTKKTLELSQEMVRQGLDFLWCGSARCNIDTGLLPPLRKSGLFYITFGLETASNRMLKKIRKGYTSDIAKKAVQKAHECGMWVSLNIIVGLPQETEEDFEDTFDFILQNIDFIDQMNVCDYYLVKSEIFLHPERFGIKIRSRVGSHKHLTSGEFAYDEIGGHSWEELKTVKSYRNIKLKKLFNIFKKIGEDYYRSNTYELFYAFERFRDKQKAYQYVLKGYNEMNKKTQKTINLIRSSNNKSYFDDCADEIWNYDKIVGEMKNLKRRYSTIILSGGEPTLVNSLFLIIRGLKDAGLDVILYTNARMLSIERYCKELRRTGLHRISVQLFSHLPDFHDEITQVRGSFEQTIKGIENWKRLGGHVDIRTEPLEQNRDDMSGFVDFMIRLENIHDI